MNENLYLALLAMNSYDRGYGARLDLNAESQIGTATATIADGGAQAQEEDYYAQAYSWAGKTVISYRGTDNLTADPITGWPIGGGSYDAPQAGLGAQFYRTITGGTAPRSDVILTGHSLGGGLAGFVGSIYGTRAVVYDNMPFELAALKLYADSSTDPDLRQEFYNGNAPLPPYPAPVEASAVVGEFLEDLRHLQRTTVKPVDPGPGTELGTVQLHSQALMVTLLYGYEYGGTEWLNAARHVLPWLFDEGVATAVKAGEAAGAADAADKMMRMIAYSALDEGNRPFGDAAMPVLFNDANDLGEALGAGGASATLTDAADALGRILVQYAGQLAVGKVFKGTTPGAMGGVLSLADDKQTLAVDFSEALWSIGTGGTASEDILGRQDLTDKVFAVSGATGSDIRFGMNWLWNDDSSKVVDRVVFATKDGALNTTIPDRDPALGLSDKVTIFAAGGSDDTVTGSTGRDFLYGGDGDDILHGGSEGEDLLAGGDGDDTLTGGTGRDYLAGGRGKDTVRYEEADEAGVTLSMRALDGGGSASYAALELSISAEDTDRATGIEMVRLTEKADKVTLQDSQYLYDLTRMKVDAGGQQTGYGDTLDLSEIRADSPILRFLNPREGFKTFDGTVLEGSAFEGARVSGSWVEFKNFEILKTGSADDYIVGNLGFKQIDTGAGNDVVGELKGSVLPWQSGGDAARLNWVTVDLGAGDDTVLGGMARGSEISVGEGRNSVHLSPDTIVYDLDADDKVYYNGLRLHGGVRNKNSDSPYAYSPFTHLFRFGINGKKQLAIDSPLRLLGGDEGQYRAWIDNFQQGPARGSVDDTAGIYLFEMSLEFKRLMDPSVPQGWVIEAWRVILGDLAKAAFGFSLFEGVDPLVLDLDGDGLELKSLSYSGTSPHFDMDGDRYAEATAWVKGDDGILVRDLNGNGQIDDVHEMFGNAIQSGFAELATYDLNGDGKVDGADVFDADGDGAISGDEAAAGELRIWRDRDGDAVVGDGELLTLEQAGVASISLAHTATPGKKNVGNEIAAEGSFTRTDGTTGTVSDVHLQIDNFSTTFRGDNTVSTTVAASGLPNVKGHGTVTDLHVALTLEEAAGAARPLHDALVARMPLATADDPAGWRAAMRPVLAAWAAASPRDPAVGATFSAWWSTPPDAKPGDTVIGGLAGRPDLHVLVKEQPDGPPEVIDYLYFGWKKQETTDAQGVTTTSWTGAWQFGSGRPVTDQSGGIIEVATLQQALAHIPGVGESWDVITAGEIEFLNNYLGESLDWGRAPAAGSNNANMLSGIGFLFENLNAVVTRLVVDGPLKDSLFAGIAYDPETDDFHPTTERGLVPVYERILAITPGGDDGIAFLEEWNPVVRTIVSALDRGEETLTVNPSWYFASIVAAYENVPVDIDIVDVADAFGLNRAAIRTGTGIIEGVDNPKLSNTDLFYLNAGDEVARGGKGQDAYIIGRNFGHDVVDDIEPELGAEEDTVRFAQTKSSEVTAWRDGTDLVIDVAGTGDQLRIVGQFTGSQLGVLALEGVKINRDQGVGFITFADGAVWDRADMARAVSRVDPGSTEVTGTDATDMLEGGTGDDTLIGLNGSDIYVFGRGYGHDSIQDLESLSPVGEFPDILTFRTGITLSDLILERPADSDDLTIRIRGTDDSVSIKGQFAATYTGVFGTVWLSSVDNFAFESGGSLDNDELMGLYLDRAQTDGDDSIYGFSREDRLDGGAGDDFLSGGNENDTYVFGRGYGHDVIQDKTANILSGMDDRLEFGRRIAVDDVQFAREGESMDLLVSIKGTDDTLRIKNFYDVVETGPFGAQAFDRIEEFCWADGTVKSWVTIQRELIAAAKTDGDDFIVGTHFDDTLDGGAGNDTLKGSDGNDVYRFGFGYGDDTVFDDRKNILTGREDAVLFGPGVTRADVSFSRPVGSDDLVVHLSDGSAMTIRNCFQVVFGLGQYEFNRIEEFRFADDPAATWTLWDVQNILLAGTPGNDTLEGFSLDETLDGGAGDDLLIGHDGDDTYVFGRGYGQDVIRDQETNILAGPEGDIVRFAAGVAPEDITVRRAADGRSLVLGIRGTADTLTLENQTDYTVINFRPNEVERFAFADGTAWTPDNLRRLYLEQVKTDGDDTIDAFYTADTLDGGLGNDLMRGGDGVDTYLWSPGQGNDTIKETVHYVTYQDAQDTVVFGAAVTPDNLRALRSGNSLVLTVEGHQGSLTIEDVYGIEYNRVEYFRFTDGTQWTLGDLTSFVTRGTAGNDTVSGTPLADTMVGGGGDDRLEGGDASDRYVYTSGDGDDTIDEYSGNADEIAFGAGITAADVTAIRVGNDLVLEVGEAGSVRILNQNSGSSYDQIERFAFADGTVLSAGDMAARAAATAAAHGATHLGTRVADVLNGSDQADVILARGGDDAVNGGHGADTYVYARGDGNDTIWDSPSTTAETDVLALADLNAADIGVARAGNDLHLTVLATGERILVDEYFSVAGGAVGIDRIVFADGTTWDRAQIEERIWFVGTDGDDTLTGGASAESFLGGRGNDWVNGGGGGDTYLYRRGDGSDRLIDASGGAGADRLRLADLNLADLAFAKTSTDLLITVKSDGAVLRLVGQYTDATAGMEEIVFADGTVWTRADMAANVTAWADVLAGTPGNDALTGTAVADVLQGGLGNDTLTGQGGSDSYAYGAGDGDDLILESYDPAGTDTLVFGPGITAADLLLTRLGNDTDDLTIRFANRSGSVHVDEQFYGYGYGIEQVAFADGTVWTLTELRAAALAQAQTAAADTVYGFEPTDDTLQGGAGNDSLGGLGGSDSYVYGVGDGADQIFEGYGPGSTDRLVLGAGIAASDLRLTRSTGDVDDLTISFANAPGSVFLDEQFYGHGYGIEQIAFADGTQWTRADIEAAYLAQAQTASADTVHGFDTGNDTLQGGAGNDSLGGLGGSDSYVYGVGDGADQIFEGYGPGSTDRLVLGAGIAASDLRLTRPTGDVDDLTISFANAPGSVFLDEQFYGHGYGIEQIAFADGTQWSRADIQAAYLAQAQTAGNDLVYGFDTGPDTLQGGAGNDTLNGLGGADDYVYSAGDGDDAVYEGYGPGHTDRLVLGAGITAGNVIVTRSANDTDDVTIRFDNAAGSIFLDEQFYGHGYGIEQISFADGTVWDKQAIMARAMLGTTG